MYSFKDISVYFSPKCCNKALTASSESVVDPCQNYGPARWSRALEYYKKCPSGTLIAATITIGNKLYGKLNWKDQIIQMQKEIKNMLKYARYKEKNIKYFATFEYQKNGQIHSHLILENSVNQGLWIEHMSKFGRHNTNSKSYQVLADIEGYFKYITKNEDQLEKYWITNIK